MLEGAQRWFDAGPRHFPFDGGRRLASVFPDLANGLSERLAQLIADGNEHDLAFALAALSTYEGKEVDQMPPWLGQHKQKPVDQRARATGKLRWP